MDQRATMTRPGEKGAICIFDYFGYREYLADVFNYLKVNRKGFSHRSFSREAGIASHNFLPRILQGTPQLSREYVQQVAQFLKLGPKEEKYLSCLVDFNNARKPSDKERCLKHLLSLRVVNNEYRLKDEKLHFFDKWYYPVVRELVVICDFQEDYNKLARHCVPRITARQAKSAVAFLLDNGLIQRGDNGRYSVTNAIISTEPEVDSAIIPKYHKITLKQCLDAVESVKREDRSFSSSTLLVSKKLYREIKEEIFHFRKRLLSMAKDCPNPEMVCFTGFQLLPRSEPIQNDGAETGGNAV